jgi:hypothetical protein
MFATPDLSKSPSRGMNRQPREHAYGPSRAACSTRGTKQIDLWMGMVGFEAMLFCKEQVIKVDQWRLSA